MILSAPSGQYIIFVMYSFILPDIKDLSICSPEANRRLLFNYARMNVCFVLGFVVYRSTQEFDVAYYPDVFCWRYFGIEVENSCAIILKGWFQVKLCATWSLR